MPKLRVVLSSLIAVLVVFAAAGCGDDSGSVSETGSGSGSGSGSGTASDTSAVSPAAQESELEANPWRLASMPPLELVAGVPAGFTFASGAVVGTAGCNRLTGSYEVDGDSIEIGPFAATQMACEQNLMDQEAAVANAMEAATTFGIDGDTLELIGDDGTVLLTFTSAPGETF